MLLQEDQNLDIWIDSEGQYFIDETVYEKDVLQSFLQEQSEKNPKVVLHVNADKDTSHRHIVYLLDIATELGLQELSVGTKMSR